MNFYIFLSFLLSSPAFTLAQTPTTASVDRNSPTVTTCNAYTSCPTLNVGGSVSTINIGSTGSTINIGPLTGSSPTLAPTPLVTINGRSPTSWSEFTQPSVSPNIGGTANYFTFAWSTTNTNTRASPTTSVQVTSCGAAPTVQPTVTAVNNNDCFNFQVPGIYNVAINVNAADANQLTKFLGAFFKVAAAASAPIPQSYATNAYGSNNGAKGTPLTWTQRVSVTSAPSLYAVGINAEATSQACSNYPCTVFFDYLSPL